MLILSKDLHPGMVVWAYKAPYYDDPYKVKFNDKGMYLITKVNYDYFFGCPIVASNSPKNTTILHKSIYPLRYDSRINECIYKIIHIYSLKTRIAILYVFSNIYNNRISVYAIL